MGHYSEKTAAVRAWGWKAASSLGLQVSDVQKPLAAVWRIAEKGNAVQLGPQDEGTFVLNLEPRRKIFMFRMGRS